MQLMDLDGFSVAPPKEVNLTTIMEKTLESGARLSYGTAVFPPGARVPDSGTAAHEADEYSFIIKGRLSAFSGGESYEVKGGQASMIPAGEQHWSVNESDQNCLLVWMFIEEGKKPAATGE